MAPHCSDQSIGRSVRRLMQNPRGSRPSIAASATSACSPAGPARASIAGRSQPKASGPTPPWTCSARRSRGSAAARRARRRPRRGSSFCCEDEPPPLDRVALQALEKAHAEQALLERAGAGDERAHVAHHDRTDGDLIEPDCGHERRAIGGGDRDVEREPRGVDAGASRVGGFET